MPNTTQSYQAALTKFIQAHMVMLGPSVILSLVRKVPGISVTNTGVVQQIEQNSLEVVKQVSSVLVPFGGVLTQRIQAQLFNGTTSPLSSANSNLRQL